MADDLAGDLTRALARELILAFARGLTRTGLALTALAVLVGLALCLLSSLPERPR